MIYTFWEGEKPAYIELCMETWGFDYVELNYNNLHQHTDLPIDRLQRFTLPQVADCVRVHVLRDNGGQWLDADTIMLGDRLPEEAILGDPDRRTNSIGYLNADNHPEMFREWAEYQDRILEGCGDVESWSVMGNTFTDIYLTMHRDVPIGQIRNCWPETYMIRGDLKRWQKYVQFYFEEDLHLSDLDPTPMLMLHNSWTPSWYKGLYREEVPGFCMTLSNIFEELLG